MERLDPLDESKEFGAALDNVLHYILNCGESEDFLDSLVHEDDVTEAEAEILADWIGDGWEYDKAPQAILDKCTHVWVQAFTCSRIMAEEKARL